MDHRHGSLLSGKTHGILNRLITIHCLAAGLPPFRERHAMNLRLCFRFASLTLGLLLAAPPTLWAQAPANKSITDESFLRPPPEIADAVLAPRHRNAALGNPSPDGRFFVAERSGGLPTMAAFAKPFYRLGGHQIDWRANRERRMTTRSGVGLDLVDARTGDITSVRVPDGVRVSSPTWSPDGSVIAFFGHSDDATHVYVADPSTGRARQVTRSPVLATLVTSYEWTPDSRSIVTVLVPEDRGTPPVRPTVPAGPQVRITTPETNRIRTYADLLEDPYEMSLFEHFTTGQLAIVDVQNRRTRRVGPPGMIRAVDVSPDGMHAHVSTVQRPFSYIVPTRQFGDVDEVWSLESGSVLAHLTERSVRDGSPNDTTDSDDTEPEKRNLAWRPDGQGLSFLQMAPRQPGDSARQDDSTQTDDEAAGSGRSRRKDRVIQWLPPYDSTSTRVVYESSNRLADVRYSPDVQTLFLTERRGETTHEYAVLLSKPEEKHTIWRGRRARFGRGGAPTIVTKSLANGASVVRVSPDGKSVFLSGTDYSDDPVQEGPKTYIDRIEIESGDKTRVYESDNGGVWERVLQVLDDDATRLLVSREGPNDVPDSYIRDLTSGEFTQLTQNEDYTPALTRAVRRRYDVTRADSFEIAVNVTLPEGWTGERLPGMIWFYPREYTDQDSYDEVRERYNKNRFPAIGTRSMEILTLRGYAVIQPDAPIVGESGRMNDNYEHDLRNNLAAVIDRLDAEGIIDRTRLGIGGHSYGAFGTVNAMVHTPFFKAGIAGDGNFNRTLTPFAFQSERRTLWQSKDTYFSMSPLFFANNLTGALLLYHGADDQNVGTFPINSWRLFEALESLGKTASLYVYPYEEHGPATQETLLDLWARWSAWLDTYVKGIDSEELKTTTGQ